MFEFPIPIANGQRLCTPGGRPHAHCLLAIEVVLTRVGAMDGGAVYIVRLDQHGSAR